MSVKQEPSGRRSVETAFEVHGTPEEVWRAIATGPGISSWFVPTDVEERDGKPVELAVHFSPGVDIRSAITAWDAPRMFRTEAAGWMPGSPPIASEWSVEARGGGTCMVRIVQSLFASTDDWDMQLEAAKGGFASFLEILRIYLKHFRGQRAAVTQLTAPAPGADPEAWDALTAAVGVKGLKVGQRFAAPAGAPPFSGVVEYLTHEPFDALLRLEQPAPGVAALGIAGYPGGPSSVAMFVYLYGDQAAERIAREKSGWEGWFGKAFPVVAGAS